MAAMIEVDHVTKEFRLGAERSLKRTLLDGARRMAGKPVEERPPFKALDDVHFSIEPGEVVGIIGHNGAGKSTLLKLLANIASPTHGRVAVRGRVAPLIEVGAGLIGELTGRENVFLNAAILGMSKAEITRKLDDIVAFAELEEFIDTPIKRYSSGMQVRLGFAIATSVPADVLIVDEVIAVGDLAFQRKCFDRMEHLILSQGRTVLLVSHNIRQVERMCSRAILLDHGRVALDTDAKTVCNAFYEVMDRKVQANAGEGAGRNNFKSTGQVEFVELALLDSDGNKTESVECGDDVWVSLKFVAREPLINPVFAVGFHTGDFVYLTTPRSLGKLSEPLLQPGPFEVRCRTPRFPLLPGVYALRASISSGQISSTILYVENCWHFQVAASGLERSMVAAEGLFQVAADWELCKDHPQGAVDLRPKRCSA